LSVICLTVHHWYK